MCAPHPSLLKMQRWIHKNILMHVHSHPASYAYKEKTSPRDAAAMHAGCKWMIKLGATNFFESILEPDVYRVFREMGYQALVAFELARICTRVRPSGNPVKTDRFKDGMGNLPCKNVAIGHLPQGAATSPLLSNLVARTLDHSLAEFANSKDLAYTRYADDLTFSSFGTFNRDGAENIVREIYEIMRAHGLWPNKSKTKIIPPGARKVVLGLLADGHVPKLSKEFKAEVRTHIHFMLRPDVGVSNHRKARKFDNSWGLKNFIFGKLAYAQAIEPIWTSRMRDLFMKIDWDS
ncbi:TPA: RNA-directed DNA polymerase [Pseudomonas putida]|nr:RNA-directed DNA polymerase [Pseudomonas putida]